MRKRFGGRAAAGPAAALREAEEALEALAREWTAQGLDPRRPVVGAMLRPALERKLEEGGQMAAFRAAGVDPWAVLCAAFDAADGGPA